MKLATTRELFSYWNVLRRARAAPELADFDPTTVRQSLPDMFSLEVDAAGRWPVRLAGARVEAAFGTLERRSFLEICSEGAVRRDIARMLRVVADEQVAVVAGARARDGETMRDLEVLLLPLRDGGRTHAQIIGAIAPAGAPPCDGRARLADLSTLRVLRQEDLAPAAATSPGQRPRRLGHLIVFQGGKASAAPL